MKRTLALCLLCFATAAYPAEPKPNETVLLTVRGTLKAHAQPVPEDASFYLAPSQTHTAVELSRDGTVVVKAVAAREYSVDINAKGFAPIRRVAVADAKGNVELGALELQPLKVAKVSVVVGAQADLKTAPAQQLELQHGSCANVRAADDSGCLLSFCVHQDGEVLRADRYGQSGTMQKLGRISLADALGKLRAGGTFVTGGEGGFALLEGETLTAQLHDAYCGALVHIDAVSPAAQP